MRSSIIDSLSLPEPVLVLTLPQAVEAYISSKSRQLSPVSIKSYRQSLSYLLKRFDDDTQIEDIDKTSMIRWRDSLFENDLSIYTVRRIHGDAATFFNWCTAVGLLGSSPLEGVKKVRAPDQPPKAISTEDFEKLLVVAGRWRGNKWRFKKAYEDRNTAILFVLASTGCRVGELCSMETSTLIILDDGGQIDVTGKGRGSGKIRTVFLSDVAALAVLEWLDSRPACAHAFLFVGIEGKSANKPLTETAVRQMLIRLADRAGIEGKFNPHSFRHACAREWLKAGADLATVSQLLGHSDIRVTAKFYARWTKTELQDRHKLIDWTKSG